MSLATLKRKSAVGQNLSTNKIFSTKGVIRNLRGIGSTPQITSDTRTIFKGASPTVCGGLTPQSYVGPPLIGNCNFNIESVPTSTMTTKGLLLSRVYHPVIKSAECVGDKKTIWWVKNFNPLDHSQSEYMRILNVKKSANECIIPEESIADNVACHNYKIGSRKTVKNTYNKRAKKGAMSSGAYTKINLLRNNCLPPPPCKQPFPFMREKRGCNTEYITPEEAMLGTALPPDWLKCSSTYPTYYSYTVNPYT
jgi:hypothetical protein